MPKMYPDDAAECSYLTVEHGCSGTRLDQANARPKRLAGPRRIGYAGAKPDQNDLRAAVLELQALRVDSEDIYIDRGLDLRAQNRPELQTVLQILDCGDTLVCASMTRLARSHNDLANVVGRIADLGVSVELAGEVLGDMSTAEVLRLSAEFEVELVKETMAALRRARATVGEGPAGHRTLTPGQRVWLRDLFDAGLPRKDLARLFGVSLAAIHRVASSSSAAD